MRYLHTNYALFAYKEPGKLVWLKKSPGKIIRQLFYKKLCLIK